MLYTYVVSMSECRSASTHQTFCQFMLNSCSTNPADIKGSYGQTAADMARVEGHRALARYVEAFQPGPRGELSSCCTICDTAIENLFSLLPSRSLL